MVIAAGKGCLCLIMQKGGFTDNKIARKHPLRDKNR